MAEPVQTGMRLWSGTEWTAAGHVSGEASPCDHEVPRAQIKVRRVGWLDQKGMVWLDQQDWIDAGGPNGSITPLLIVTGCD